MLDLIKSNLSGIYSIRNVRTGKQYIGSAQDVLKRLKAHVYKLRANKHPNLKLQNTWSKHGETFFECRILEEVEVESLLEREQYWLDYYNVVDDGYNINPIAGSSRGVKRGPRSEEVKAKISAAQKGRKFTEEHKAALRTNHVGMTGKKQSEEFCEKMSELHLNKIMSEESKVKMRNSLRQTWKNKKDENVSN